MSTLDSRCLEAFPGWLRSLAHDAGELASVLEGAEASAAARKAAAVAVSYLFKSLDLIPDGLEDLGFLDDAFVLRVAAARASEGDSASALAKLGADAELIREFLADDYARLERYVDALGEMEARGRKVSRILEDDVTRDEVVRELRQWAASYAAPSFLRDTRSLVKLKSFLSARLPA
jgi:uncharacterized membrane protein YkvA (DUF1232 family)